MIDTKKKKQEIFVKIMFAYGKKAVTHKGIFKENIENNL